MHPLITIIASLLELTIFLFILIEFVPSYCFSYTKTYIQLVSRKIKFIATKPFVNNFVYEKQVDLSR